LDKLLSEHKDNVLTSLGAFREVSKDIRACREKIKSVQNSLQISHTLLQSRRDELKKLWLENLEQKKICEILQQINDIKNLDRLVDGLIKEQKFEEAVQQLKRADILLNGPLSMIEGLVQLRNKVMDLSQVLLLILNYNLYNRISFKL
jgi:exocyst complex component 4